MINQNIDIIFFLHCYCYSIDLKLQKKVGDSHYTTAPYQTTRALLGHTAYQYAYLRNQPLLFRKHIPCACDFSYSFLCIILYFFFLQFSYVSFTSLFIRFCLYSYIDFFYIRWVNLFIIMPC